MRFAQVPNQLHGARVPKRTGGFQRNLGLSIERLSKKQDSGKNRHPRLLFVLIFPKKYFLSIGFEENLPEIFHAALPNH